MYNTLVIPQIIIDLNSDNRTLEIERVLTRYQLSKGHPNLIWIDDEKLGISQVKKIQEHLNLKPFQGIHQAVVITFAQNLTPEAQNSLLKTLEEPPGESLIIFGAPSEYNFLPTVLSRCQVVYLSPTSVSPNEKHHKKIVELINLSMENRFSYIEKLEDKEEFLRSLVVYFTASLHQTPDKKTLEFVSDLIDAQMWAKQNVNIRAILEYLMLKLPPNNPSINMND